MGGLISLYALLSYPQIFGGAACVSTHWVAGAQPLIDHLAARLPPPGAHKFYFDFGTETLDAEYEPWQKLMDEKMRAAGYVAGRDWLTRKFPGAAHHEPAWRARAEIPFEFLLG
jgi:predicted alpha/beta superfamily hydrolase